MDSMLMREDEGGTPHVALPAAQHHKRRRERPSVEGWLDALGLADKKEAFRREAIDVEALARMDHGQLQDMVRRQRAVQRGLRTVFLVQRAPGPTLKVRSCVCARGSRGSATG